MAGFAGLATALVEDFQRRPDIDSETISEMPSYWPFVEGAAESGWTDTELAIDGEFADRTAEWVAGASHDERRQWIHSVLRAERWSSECPTAVLAALRGGQMQAFERCLSSEAG